MSKKSLFYLAFFVVLVVGFYFAMTRLIPGFGKVELPVLSYVQPFAFTNQAGKVITEKDMRGKVAVVEYFFTTCKGICPKMNMNMQQVYKEYKSNPDFRILSHTVDPLTDSVPTMKRYADSLGADPASWWFLTGSKDSLYAAARNSYLLDDPKNNTGAIDEQFIHTQFFALVDKEGKVRKVYDGLKKEELEQLKEDIGTLLKN
ncbi:MAG TPA: SCO family protein [Chitinophagaceae bacterium]|nr:SCO family protein [Chitinophagaceae bacterium]